MSTREQIAYGERTRLDGSRAGARAHARQRAQRSRSVRLPLADLLGALAVAGAIVVVLELAVQPALVLLGLAILFPIGIAATGCYSRAEAAFGERWYDDVPAILGVGAALGWLGTILVHAFGSTGRLYGPLILWWGLLVPVALTLRSALRSGRAPERALIVGAGEVGRFIASRLDAHPEYGVRAIGFLDDDPPLEAGTGGRAVLGGVDELERAIEAHGVSRVIFAFSNLSDREAVALVRRCADAGVQVDLVPRMFEGISHRTHISLLEGLPMTSMPTPRPLPGAAAAKRGLDVLVASFAVLVLSPFLSAVALMVKAGDGGRVFFLQPRVGRDGRPFRMLKFRTMREGSQDAPPLPPGVKLRSDPRITRIGRFLRRVSLDELPQLINVIKGDMSLVGPRPLPLHEAHDLPEWARTRNVMRPGMTGLWQVLGRSEIAFDERLRLDWIYVRYWSLGLDIRLLARTLYAVRTGRGAF